MTPYVIRTSLASLSGMEAAHEEAAQDLGATPLQAFFLVTLPQIKPGVIAGALFAFINSWINVEVSIFKLYRAACDDPRETLQLHPVQH